MRWAECRARFRLSASHLPALVGRLDPRPVQFDLVPDRATDSLVSDWFRESAETLLQKPRPEQLPPGP